MNVLPNDLRYVVLVVRVRITPHPAVRGDMWVPGVVSDIWSRQAGPESPSGPTELSEADWLSGGTSSRDSTSA